MSAVKSFDELPLIMRAADLAKVLGVSKDRAYRLIQRGDFDAAVVMVGGRKRISRLALERFLSGEAA